MGVARSQASGDVAVTRHRAPAELRGSLPLVGAPYALRPVSLTPTSLSLRQRLLDRRRASRVSRRRVATGKLLECFHGQDCLRRHWRDFVTRRPANRGRRRPGRARYTRGSFLCRSTGPDSQCSRATEARERRRSPSATAPDRGAISPSPSPSPP